MFGFDKEYIWSDLGILGIIIIFLVVGWFMQSLLGKFIYYLFQKKTNIFIPKYNDIKKWHILPIGKTLDFYYKNSEKIFNFIENEIQIRDDYAYSWKVYDQSLAKNQILFIYHKWTKRKLPMLHSFVIKRDSMSERIYFQKNRGTLSLLLFLVNPIAFFAIVIPLSLDNFDYLYILLFGLIIFSSIVIIYQIKKYYRKENEKILTFLQSL